jgi:hypothetical protein
MRCGGLCTDLQTDAKNCGSCGRNCGDASCSDGVCEAEVALPVRDQLFEFVVYTDGYYVRERDGVIVRYPRGSRGDDGTRIGEGWELSVAPGHLYAVADQGLVRFSHQTGARELVYDTSVSFPTWHASSVFFCDFRSMDVARILEDGGARVALAMRTDTFCSGLAVDDRNVYWTEAAGDEDLVDLYKTPVTGGTATRIASRQRGMRQIRSNGDDIVWTTLFWDAGAKEHAALMGMPVSGTTPTELFSGEAYAFEIDGPTVYWLTETHVFKRGVRSADLVKLAHAKSPHPGPRFVVDATHVYWVEAVDTLKGLVIVRKTPK